MTTVRHERWLLYGMSAAAIALAVTLLTVLVTSQRADKKLRLNAEVAADRRQEQVLKEIELVLEEVREEQEASVRAREEFRRAVLVIFEALEVEHDRDDEIFEPVPLPPPSPTASPSPTRRDRDPARRDPSPPPRREPSTRPTATHIVLPPPPPPPPRATPTPPRPPPRPSPRPTLLPVPLPVPLPTPTLPCIPIVGCAGVL